MDRTIQNDVAIRARGLTMAYRGVPVLRDADVDVVRGSRTAVIGPNGAGKSTLIKAMLQLIKPAAGFVEVDGQRRSKAKGDIAYVPQHSSVDWNFPITVYGVVRMGRFKKRSVFFSKAKAMDDKKAVENAIAAVQMEAFTHRQIGELSGGQKQRVFVARGICQDAPIYFMDEPFAGVDIKTEKIIMERVKALSEAGKTLLMVHHDLSTVKDYFTHVILINERVIAQGKVEDVFTTENVRRTFREAKEDGLDII